MSLRFVIHSGEGTDPYWAAEMGFAEFGWVVSYGGNPSAAPVKGAGFEVATLNIMNDNWGPDRFDSNISTYARQIADNGWDMIAGEGGGNLQVGTIMEVRPYCNYYGSGGADMDGVGCGMIDAYGAPWSHPVSVNYGHCDYVETYCGDPANVQPCFNSTKSRCIQAYDSGAIYSGILIGMWGNPLSWGVDYFIRLIDAINAERSGACNSVCFWSGIGTNGQERLSASAAVFNGLMSHYGGTAGEPVGDAGSGGSGGSGGTSSGDTPVPAITNPAWVYEGSTYGWSGQYFTSYYTPRLKWRIRFYPDSKSSGIENSVFEGFNSYHELTSGIGSVDQSTAGLLSMDLTVSRNIQPDSMTISLDNTNFNWTDSVLEDCGVMVWLGWENTVFTDVNYLFGGFVTDWNSDVSMNQQLDINVTGFEAALQWPQYAVESCDYEWIELSAIIGSLYGRSKMPGHAWFYNTGIITERYIANDRTLGDCIQDIVSAIDSYSMEDWEAVPSTYTKSEDPSDGLGRLYGQKKAEAWDLWMDHTLSLWISPVYRTSVPQKAYWLTYGEQLISASATQERIGDSASAKQVKKHAEFECVLIPELNVYSNNIIGVKTPVHKTGIRPDDVSYSTGQYRIDEITYSLAGTMKLSCEKLIDEQMI